MEEVEELKTLLSLKEIVNEVEDEPEVFLLIGRESNEVVEIPEEVNPVLEEFEDVFPEEFANFLLNDPEIRQVFLEYHQDLLTPEFWQKKKDNILAGIVEDFFPYPDQLRFVLNDKQKGQLVK